VRLDSGAYNTTVAATMIHELGHAVYHTTYSAFVQYNDALSDSWALTFDNAYRRSVGANVKSSHDDLTTPWRGP